jgi:DNA polymerase-1
MGVLQRAREAFARVKRERNGVPSKCSGYDRNDRYDQSPASPLAADASCAVGQGRNGVPTKRQGYDINDRNDQSPCPPPAGDGYLVITRPDQLDMAATAVEESSVVGLDCETTGLNPRTDRVRLLSLAVDTIDGGTFCFLVDCNACDPSPLWEALAERELVLHHAAFDLAFLARRGFTPTGKVHDTMLLAQLLTAGTLEKVSLAACCRRWLKRDLDKGEQKSDWSGKLTDDQLAYAAVDVEVLAPLLKALTLAVRAANLGRAAEIEQRCLPGMLWTSTNGVACDRQRWQTLAATASADAERLQTELHATAPGKPGSFDFDGWKWDSPVQAKEAFAAAGVAVGDTADETLAALDHPLADLLRQYRDAKKRGTTYGRDWLQHVAEDDRVYAGWKQIGAKTGRMACREPNLQNLPRDPAYRQCFRPGAGRVLVKADYSQIELRIVAKVANESRMIEAYRRGDDLHVLTARRMTGKAGVSRQERQLAKPVNFGLIYGLGAPSLRRKAKTEYGLDLSEEDAQRYRRAFFDAYPAIQTWHHRIKRQRSTETRTLAGRRVLVDADGFFGAKANYVVQGTGGDGVKAALGLLWERRQQVPGAFPVMVIHDEIVVEAPADKSEDAAAWLKQAMLDGMAPLIDPVPVEVEVKTGPTWGGP